MVAFPPTRYTLLESIIPFSSKWTIKQVIKLFFSHWVTQKTHDFANMLYSPCSRFCFLWNQNFLLISMILFLGVSYRYMFTDFYNPRGSRGWTTQCWHRWETWSRESQPFTVLLSTKGTSNSMVSSTFCLSPIPYSILNSMWTLRFLTEGQDEGNRTDLKTVVSVVIILMIPNARP